MANPRYSDVAPRRGEICEEPVHGTQHGPGKAGKPEKHGGAHDMGGDFNTNAELQSKPGMSKSGPNKAPKKGGGSATRGY